MLDIPLKVAGRIWQNSKVGFLANCIHPFVRTFLALFHFIESRPCNWNSLTIFSREEYLKVLQRSRAESRDRPREVEPPESNEFRPELFGNSGRRVLEAFEPVLQCPGVMRPKILYVGDGKIAWLEEVHHLP